MIVVLRKACVHQQLHLAAKAKLSLVLGQRHATRRTNQTGVVLGIHAKTSYNSNTSGRLEGPRRLRKVLSDRLQCYTYIMNKDHLTRAPASRIFLCMSLVLAPAESSAVVRLTKPAMMKILSECSSQGHRAAPTIFCCMCACPVPTQPAS